MFRKLEFQVAYHVEVRDELFKCYDEDTHVDHYAKKATVCDHRVSNLISITTSHFSLLF